MCGIVGIVNKRVGKVHNRNVQNASDLLKNRGPDDSGIWVEGNVGFGHRRLSILDLTAAGHQPMVSSDGRYAIVHNGEIYNFKALKQELNGDPSAWRGSSDTEVILAAYARWGTRCVEHFHGMFAFAIWDRQDKTLFAARDRMGVKPLYYYHASDCLAFASRPKALFEIEPSIPRQIDEQAVRYFVTAGYIPSDFSIFRDIKKLPPAHWLFLDGDGLRVKRYWDFRTIRPQSAWENRPEEDLLDELDDILATSVNARMISDVPLGAFLSGGIDSSLVVAQMIRHSSSPVKTFTIGFNDSQYDESNHAWAVAKTLGTKHRTAILKVDDLLDLMPVYLKEFDEPFFDYSAFPVMAVSRMTRESVTVSLSGDGGDELFGGYHYYQIAEKLRLIYRLPASARKGIATLVGRFPGHRLKLLASAIAQQDLISAFAFSRSIIKDFKNPLDSVLLKNTSSLQTLFQTCAEQFPPGLPPAEQGMRLDAIYTLPEDYLQKVDMGSMAYSLEVRNPMLDQDVVEWAQKLPLKFKLRGRDNKYLLRKLAYRYIPEEILNRPKQGFEVPMGAWLRGPLKEWAVERLNDGRSYDVVPLEKSAVLSLWELHLSGKRNVQSLLWAILMLLDFSDRL